MPPKTIAHIDMDAFFAAVEQKDNPSLCGQPVVVGADPKEGRGRGVVSTCSYEARKFGIHSAMPISEAYRRCPNAHFLRGRMKRYRKVSEEIFNVFYDFTPDIEPIGIDEAFLDLTGTFHFFKTPRETGLKIKQRIKSTLGLTASVGIAPVKMAAKIASDLCKPDGLLEVTQDNLLEFLWALPIEKLWGVGPATQKGLNAMRVKSVGQLARVSREALYQCFGEPGLHLHDLANGIDERGVEADEKIKSVSHEHTFDKDSNDIDEITAVVINLSEKVSRRLRKYGLKGKTLTLKIRLKGFQTYTRAVTLPERTNHVDTIYQRSRELFLKFYKRGMQIRLIGVRLSNFEDPYVKDSLFESVQDQRSEKIHKAVDLIKDKFGEGAIHRAR